MGLNLVKGALNGKLVGFNEQFESNGTVVEFSFENLIAEADKHCGVTDTLTVKPSSVWQRNPTS